MNNMPIYDLRNVDMNTESQYIEMWERLADAGKLGAIKTIKAIVKPKDYMAALNFNNTLCYPVRVEIGDYSIYLDIV